MPLWRIYTPLNLLTPSQKSSLAQAITANYTRVPLPAFYVTILFIPLQPSDIFVSGLPLDHPSSNTPPNFLRISVEHVARHAPTLEIRKGMMERINKIVADPLKIIEAEIGQEIRWEITISETPRELWRFNGLVPPEAQSEGEALWIREDRPVDYFAQEVRTSGEGKMNGVVTTVGVAATNGA